MGMKTLLMVVVGLVAAAVIAGLTMPTTYAIEKSVEIQGTTAEVHALVGDLQRWEEWAPWYEDDPSIVNTLGEKTTGVGASQSWTSDSGDGELTFTKCDAASGIAYDMAFIMEDTRAPAKSAMSYSAEGDTTTVTWTMEGNTADFMPPVVRGLMTPLMKGEIGGMFEKGLETLKGKVEAAD